MLAFQDAEDRSLCAGGMGNEGRAVAKAATASGSAGRALNPSGSIS
jgi:hypothetical protein